MKRSVKVGYRSPSWCFGHSCFEELIPTPAKILELYSKARHDCLEMKNIGVRVFKFLFHHFLHDWLEQAAYHSGLQFPYW